MGRAFAVLLAIALLTVTPVLFRAQIRSGSVNSMAQAALDEFTAQAEKESAVTLISYERLLDRLSKAGLVCDAQLQIGRRELKYSGEDVRTQLPNAVRCATHVHTSACYRNHNHAAEGCDRHVHGDSCYCRGRLTAKIGASSELRTCSTCNGTGMTGGSLCSSCNGAGSWYPVVITYACNSCGASSQSYHDGVCGRMICKLTPGDYSCGITENDTNPICDRVIVDVSYEDYLEVKRNDVLSSVCTELTVLYLNGEEGTVTAVARGPEVFTECGGTTVVLEYTGYYGNASTYETRSFPMYVEVTEQMLTCNRCSRQYYPDPDGTDSGCPYCYTGVVGIRVECTKKVYHRGEELEAEVYAVFDDGRELRVPAEETWNTFSTQFAGDITVFVGYLQFMQEVEVSVCDDEPRETPTPAPYDPGENDESDPDGEPESGDPGGGQQDTEADVTGVEKPDYVRGVEDIIDSVHSELLGTEEIIEMLTDTGRIPLNPGDAFSVRITVRNAKGYTGLLRNRRKTFTSGIVAK